MSSPKVLHPSASLVTVNDAIWKMYFDGLLPLFTVDGDDGSYAETVALDFACLQVLSRRIHIGKYVAEVKFKDDPQDYSPLIRAKVNLQNVTFSASLNCIIHTELVYLLILCIEI
jgi:chorismate mutase